MMMMTLSMAFSGHCHDYAFRNRYRCHGLLPAMNDPLPATRAPRGFPADAARAMAQPRLLVAHDEAHARERVSAIAGHNHHDLYLRPTALLGQLRKRRGGCANHMFTAASTTAALAASSLRQCAHGPQ